jgi:hypothetical protein
MSKAPRRVEAAVPAPARTPRSKNPKASKFWHQGYGVVTRNSVAVVPFLHQDTARRVAAQATRNTEIPMTVEPHPGGYWYYTPAADVPAQRKETS